MLPVHPIYNVSDVTPRNSCHILKLHVCIFSRLVHFSNLFHVLFSKFTHSVLSSVWHNAFARRIQGVFCACTNPQVRGINTRGIVTDRTIMANKHSTGNGSEMKNPTCPVCPNVFLGTTPTPNHTVFVWPKLSIPYPARFGNKDFLKNLLGKLRERPCSLRYSAVTLNCSVLLITCWATLRGAYWSPPRHFYCCRCLVNFQ